MERIAGIDHLGGWSRDDAMKAERLRHRRAAAERCAPASCAAARPCSRPRPAAAARPDANTATQGPRHHAPCHPRETVP